MPDRYWVGGTGTWNSTSTTNWSATSGGPNGASAPTAADSVFFDQAGSYTVTVSGSVSCLDFTASAGTIVFAGGSSPTLSIAGSLTLATSLTWSMSGILTFTSTVAGRTITTNNISIASPIVFNGSGGVWTLGSNFTTGASSTTSISNGTLNTNNYNYTSGSTFTASGGTFNMGSSTISVTVFTRLSTVINAGTSTILCSAAGGTFAGNSATYYNVSFNFSGGTSPTITGSNTFNDLTFVNRSSSPGVGGSVVTLAGNQIINGTFRFPAPTSGNIRYSVISSVAGVQRTLTCAAIVCSDVDFRDIIIAGAAAPLSGTRIGDLGGNSGITFSTPKTVYRVGTSTAWAGSSSWATTSGGAGSNDNYPLPQDTAIFDNAATPSSAITFNSFYVSNLDCSSRTNAMTFNHNSTGTEFCGSYILGSGVNVAGSSSQRFTGRGTMLFASAGKTITFPINLESVGGTLQLSQAVTVSNSLTVTRGILNTDGFAVSVTDFISSNSNVRTINLGASIVTLGSGLNFATSTNLTFNAGTSQINRVGFLFTFSGGGRTFYDINLSDFQGGTIEGANTFRNFTVVSSGATPTVRTINFAASQTITGTLTLNGASPVARLRVGSNDATRPRRTISAAVLVSTDCDFEDFGLAGAAVGTSPIRAGDRGNNNNIIFPAAKTVYRVGNNTTWTGSASWATTSGGSGSNDNYPLAQDTAVIDNNTTLTGTLTISSVSMSGLDCSTRTTTITLSYSTGVEILGSIKLGSGVALAGSSNVTISGYNRTIDIASAGKTIPFGIDIRAGASGAPVYLRLLDACSISTILAVYGSINLNGFTLTVSSFTSSNPFFANDLTFNGGTMIVSSSSTSFNVTTTNFTTTVGTGAGTISMTSASPKTFAGNGRTYNCTVNNGGSGSLTITGSNTFTTLSNSVQPTSFLFTAGTTQTLTNWNINGAPGSFVTIGSTTTVSHTLFKSTGIVNASYLSISRSNATGGATWIAGTTSINGIGNSGWLFTEAQAGSSFFLFLS